MQECMFWLEIDPSSIKFVASDQSLLKVSLVEQSNLDLCLLYLFNALQSKKGGVWSEFLYLRRSLAQRTSARSRCRAPSLQYRLWLLWTFSHSKCWFQWLDQLCFPQGSSTDVLAQWKPIIVVVDQNLRSVPLRVSCSLLLSFGRPLYIILANLG